MYAHTAPVHMCKGVMFVLASHKQTKMMLPGLPCMSAIAFAVKVHFVNNAAHVHIPGNLTDKRTSVCIALRFALHSGSTGIPPM